VFGRRASSQPDDATACGFADASHHVTIVLSGIRWLPSVGRRENMPVTKHCRVANENAHPRSAPLSRLQPVWMSYTPIIGPPDWYRGLQDRFLFADVDGDNHREVVITNPDLWAGVLKWQDSALRPVWMSYTPLAGPVTWDRAPGDELAPADVDGDRQEEVIIYNGFHNTIGLLKWQGGALQPVWKSGSPLTGPAGDWYLGSPDVFCPADIDGDGQQEILVSNGSDLWTGVLKWQDGALRPAWMSYTPLTGPVNWDVSAGDVFSAADVDGDGQDEIVIYNNTLGTMGLLKWQGSALQPVWKSGSPLTGPAGDWDRGPQDAFFLADVEGDRQQEIVVENPDLWTGVLKWQNGALQPIWMNDTLGNGFSAADVDGDGQQEIVNYNDSDGTIGLLKWQGGALQPVWKSSSPLVGPVGDWYFGEWDVFPPADVDGDGLQEIVIYNMNDLWTGVLKWNP
jgi:hypothetical protein